MKQLRLALAPIAFLAAFTALPIAAGETPQSEPAVETQAASFAEIPRGLRDRMAIQLYSYRNDLKRDLHGTLAKIRALGFRYVELYPGITPDPVDTKIALDRAGLKVMAGHVSLDSLREKPEYAVEYARLFETDRIGVAWIQSSAPFDEAQVRAAAATFNAACPTLRAAGVTPFYHIHGYEFAAYGEGTLFDLLLDLVPARCLEIQADVFWVAHGGPEPAEFIARHRGRVKTLHVKDMDRAIQTPQTSGVAPDEASVALGEGQLDIPGILAASKRAGVRWYVIEDESPHVHAQVARSLAYLARQKF